MSSLFDNAVGSIRVGVQDFRSTEDHRHVSAVRNYYAGLLLLAKEALVRRFPNEDPDKLIAANLKPVAGPNGTVEFAPASQTTIDFVTIGRRFKDLGIQFDTKLLEGLNRIRNDVEHKFSALSRSQIVEALAKGFPAVGQLFRIIDEDPVAVLGDEWQEMLRTREMFDEELAACRATLKGVKWYSSNIGRAKLVCSECGSNLVQQSDPENEDQEVLSLSCRSCGVALDTGDVIEATIEDIFGHEVYSRAKDTGEEGPIYDCPECGRAAFTDHENSCANCGYEIDSEGECSVCGETFPLGELLVDPDMTLCSYHQYVADKDD